MELRTGTPQEAGMSPQRVAHIADLARGWVEEGVTPALVILLARRGVVFLHQAFGHLTPEPDAPPLPLDAIFPIASISKPITATAAMILVEEGLLGLNRPVSWYIPEFTGQGKDAVMVHHLLTHTSGLRDEDVKAYDLDAFPEKRAYIPPPEPTEHPLLHKHMSSRYDLPLCHPPGEEMAYCSYNYELVGEIVRRVSGQAFATFCQERIFEPLGMVDSGFVLPDVLRPRLVRRAPDEPGAEAFARLKLGEVPYASGGAHSTASDLARFGQMFLNRGTYGDAQVLCPASVAEMTRNQIPGIRARTSGQYGDLTFPEASWGYGWSTRQNKDCVAYAETLHSQRAFAHGGLGGTVMWVDPTYDLLGVYLSVNSHGGIPPGVELSPRFGDNEMLGRSDLLINAATAAIADW